MPKSEVLDYEICLCGHYLSLRGIKLKDANDKCIKI